jgi:pyruvate dehydrogenase E2 component (dihydrolipoamide acetyltransferase)
MAVKVVMPRMGLTMEEGTVIRWHKGEGDAVEAGELLLEIETDKVTAEIEAKAGGFLGKILVGEGITVPIGTPICYILKEGEPVPATSYQAAEAGEKAASKQKPDSVGAAGAVPEAASRLRASPAARRAARELGIDLKAVSGSGPKGRILETDVRRLWQTGQPARATRITPVAARMAGELGIDLSDVRGTGPRGVIRKSDLISAVPAAPQREEFLEVSGARKVMAERMAESFSTAPHFYLMAQADAAALVELRQSLLPKVEAKAGVHLTYTDLLVLFLAIALKEHPMVNAAWSEGRIRMNETVNLGVAADSERGLVVPVIHGAEKLSLSEIARTRAELTEKARAGQLELDDLSGGTFTLSNLGTFRVDTFNAILNPPQAAILAVGRIHEAVIPHEGQATIRPVIEVSLTCDHRVLDGAAGARFLTRVIELIEEPFSLFV